MSASVVCAHCGVRGVGHYAVTRIDGRGANRGTVTVCSAVCLIRWAYAYTVNRGSAAVGLVQTAVQQLVGSIRGPKR